MADRQSYGARARAPATSMQQPPYSIIASPIKIAASASNGPTLEPPLLISEYGSVDEVLLKPDAEVRE